MRDLIVSNKKNFSCWYIQTVFAMVFFIIQVLYTGQLRFQNAQNLRHPHI